MTKSHNVHLRAPIEEPVSQGKTDTIAKDDKEIYQWPLLVTGVMAMGRVAHIENCPSTMCPWGQIPMGLSVLGEISMRRVVRRASCQWGKMSMRKNHMCRDVPGASFMLHRMYTWQADHSASCTWGKLSIGRVVFRVSCPCSELVHQASCLWG